MNQPTNLYDVIPADRVAPAPLYIKTLIKPTNNGLVEGIPANSQKAEFYVLMSALPTDLRRRVELAVQALQAGM